MAKKLSIVLGKTLTIKSLKSIIQFLNGGFFLSKKVTKTFEIFYFYQNILKHK